MENMKHSTDDREALVSVVTTEAREAFQLKNKLVGKLLPLK